MCVMCWAVIFLVGALEVVHPFRHWLQVMRFACAVRAVHATSNHAVRAVQAGQRSALDAQVADAAGMRAQEKAEKALDRRVAEEEVSHCALFCIYHVHRR